MRQLTIIILFLLINNSMFGQEIAKTAQIRIDSKALNQQREILVYTPQNYDENTLVPYDVIYVFDSQNREFFDFTHSVISFISNATKKYIVVGITSPYIETLDYARNNDLLPVMETADYKKRYGKYSGNADNFLNYVKYEVVPYIESNYRTRSNRTAVGHSLSASFILYSMFKEPNLFNDYFAISPNFAYDNERIATALMNFDYQKIKEKTFLYISNANEGINYWKDWKPARDNVYSFLENSKNLEKINFVIKSFPDKTHWSTFSTSLTFGLTEYFNYLDNKKVEFSKETYEITLRVRVPNNEDDVYVTGNQISLGNWNPASIKMKRISGYEREVSVKIHSPSELKFTRGTWETEGEVKNNGGFNNVIINPEKQSTFEFEIVEWVDKME